MSFQKGRGRPVLVQLWKSLNCYRRQDTCVTIVTTTLGVRTTYGCTSKDAAAVSQRHRASFVTCAGSGTKGTSTMSRAIRDAVDVAISPIASSNGTRSLQRGDNATQHTTESDVVSNESQLEPKTRWWNLMAYKISWASCSSRMMGKIRQTMWMIAARTIRLSLNSPKINLLVTTPRASNYRAYVHLEVEGDKVIIVQHVAAPPNHTVDYECLVTYNAQYLRNIRSRDLQCPACSQPFPVPEELTFSDEENDEGSEENALEYEEPDEESESEDTQDDGDNSVDEYHASDFNSSSNSDEDYAP
eukprot:jgi/Phyca11/18733/fgenesh1_pg.PHYCAscaffold_40_\